MASYKKSKKESQVVRITTIDESYMLNNYGTFLQHYALRRFLKTHGYVVYRDVWEPLAYKGPCEKLKWWYKHTISFSSIKKILKIVLTKFKVYRKYSDYAAVQYFLQPIKFRLSYTKLIGSWREYSQKTPDFCIAGSDQVFFWYDIEGHHRRFMDNAPAGSIKISYAASSNWLLARESEDWIRNTGISLKNYHAVSVRELIGQEILQEIIQDKKVVHVSDPTMLLNKSDYLEIISPEKYFKKPVLLCYMLHCNPEKLHLNELIEIAAELNVDLKIIGLQGTEKHISAQHGISPSPEDFLRAYRDAEYVITNSFHGTVFSILFETRWVSIDQVGKVEHLQNVRHKELLKVLQIEDRAVSFSKDRVLDLLKKDIDWCEIERKKTIFTSESKNWLLNALEQGKKDI